MSFISLTYLIFLIILVATYWIVIPVKRRGLFLACASFLFAASYSLFYAVLFLILGLLVYISGKVFLESRAIKKKKLFFLLVLTGIIGNLCIYKCFKSAALISFLRPDEILMPLGISYITFRLVHYLVESYRKNIPRASLSRKGVTVSFAGPPL